VSDYSTEEQVRRALPTSEADMGKLGVFLARRAAEYPERAELWTPEMKTLARAHGPRSTPAERRAAVRAALDPAIR
jgi:hypothetical protein